MPAAAVAHEPAGPYGNDYAVVSWTAERHAAGGVARPQAHSADRLRPLAGATDGGPLAAAHRARCRVGKRRHIAVFAATVVDVVYARFVTVPQSHMVSRFPHSTAGLGLLVIGACVLAPVFEETFFRGFLFQGSAAWRGAFWGAVISSALWSAVHMQPAVFVPLFVNGLLLCWVFRRGRSIWTNIAVHATINAIAVLAWVH